MNFDFLSWQSLTTLLVLIGLELVLGIDNVLVISFVVAPLPSRMRHQARISGLSLALLLRLFFITGVFSLVKLTTPFLFSFSIRDLLLLVGGIFLIVKGISELYGILRAKEKKEAHERLGKRALSAAILQIIMLDLLFSIDSVITAVGVSRQLGIIVTAVVCSFAAVLCYSGPLGEFILKHPLLKISALIFLVLIGGNLVRQGLGWN